MIGKDEIGLLLMLVALIPYTYILALAISRAYFGAKIEYQSKLVEHIKREEVC